MASTPIRSLHESTPLSPPACTSEPGACGDACIRAQALWWQRWPVARRLREEAGAQRPRWLSGACAPRGLVGERRARAGVYVATRRAGAGRHRPESAGAAHARKFQAVRLRGRAGRPAAGGLLLVAGCQRARASLGAGRAGERQSGCAVFLVNFLHTVAVAPLPMPAGQLLGLSVAVGQLPVRVRV